MRILQLTALQLSGVYCNILKECFQGINIIYIFRALKDAEKAISLADKWPKGYFRKGRALAGLRVRFYHPVER